ncbi:TLP18.3, Psb32 and MOLO-1 founding protein of phosphatase [Flavobacteriaceae bacterium MAR_2010_188]|nr:TLP18.3, Psb32 and MOLO-1 founding protein of phosphatase [Flavobacteriaceae bacterium MAR_2010_188]
MKNPVVLLLCALLFTVTTLQAQKPADNEHRINLGELVDQEGILTAEEKDSLTLLMAEIYNVSKIPVTMMILPLPEAANPLKTWTVNPLNNQSGILIMMSSTVKLINFGASNKVKAQMVKRPAKEIFETLALPEFKNGNYYKGLNAAFTAILESLK